MLDSDWLSTTFRAIRQQYVKISHGQRTTIGYNSAMDYYLIYLNEVLGLGITRYCDELGFTSAMNQSWVCINNVLGLGIAQYVLKLGNAQQSNKTGYILTMC